MSSKLKEIYVFNNGVITSLGMSGSDNRALNWSRIWSETYDVTLIIPYAAIDRYSDCKARKILTTKKNTNSTSPLYWLMSYVFRACRALLRANVVTKGPLLIYSSSDLMPDSLPAFFLKYRNRKNSRVRLVMGCHLIAPTPFIGYGSKKSGGMQSLYYFLMQKVVFGLARKFADMVLVSNKIDKQKLIDSGFSSEKVSVSYGGVNNSEVEEAPEQGKAYDFIFIGRDHPQKGIDDLVLSWKEICAKKPNSKLVVVGGIENFTELKKKLFQHRLMSNVEFAGYLSGSSKYSLLKASKVLLFTSHYESFGMVALEALACGVPVVAYDLEVYREVFEGKLITVPRGNTTALAQAALDSLSLCEDSSFTNELKWFSQKFNFQNTSRSICEGLF